MSSLKDAIAFMEKSPVNSSHYRSLLKALKDDLVTCKQVVTVVKAFRRALKGIDFEFQVEHAKKLLRWLDELQEIGDCWHPTYVDKRTATGLDIANQCVHDGAWLVGLCICDLLLCLAQVTGVIITAISYVAALFSLPVPELSAVWVGAGSISLRYTLTAIALSVYLEYRENQLYDSVKDLHARLHTCIDCKVPYVYDNSLELYATGVESAIS